MPLQDPLARFDDLRTGADPSLSYHPRDS